MGVAGVFLWSLLAVGEPAGRVEPTAEQVRHYETSVRPLLVEHCQKCHGEKKQFAGLRLDSRAAILSGGDSGPAIVPEKPAESLLIRAVRQVDDDLKMPPKSKLTDRQIADLVRWVEMGAPFPVAAKAAAPNRDPNHWAFQPPVDPPVPAVKNAAWPKSPLDNFILAKLEATGQSPAAPADRRILIRRVTFDLTGLPPTPAEIAVFLADQRPSAFADLVDRLLASPVYGERWGRHWLDVARYADSNGLDENVAHGNAWRYRDYVVSAFNHDKPYDRFLLEQLAGDLLPAADEPQRHEQLIATGFLGIGPKVLAEVDEAKMQMDIVDEQIDTVGRAILGLTLGCARCHDHKFDPIDAADYYGLAGIFKSTRTMENFKKVAKWHENVLASPETKAMQAEYEARVVAKRQAVEAFVAKADAEVRAGLPEGTKPPEKLETLYPDAVKADLKKLRDELSQLEKNPPELPSAMGATEDKVADEAIHIRGNPLKLGEVVPRHVPPVVHGPAAVKFSSAESGRRELAQWLIDPKHPLTSRVLVNRVWRWHFGKGLVATPDNFGLLGEAPSHPELLDWLARRFIDAGWSLKSLHRLILNSATYQQSSTPTPEAAAHDPENRLFGRADVRRIEAEAVRDALLAVSGRLDTTMGGTLLKVKNRGYFFDHTSKDLTDYNSFRRSLYLPVVRNNLYDVFQLLDAPDAAIPNGDRATTTVAPQALLMLNSDFVMQSAADFAGRLLSGEAADDDRMQRMYAIAYGREATAEELGENRKFLAELEQSLAVSEPDAARRQRQAWNVLCHTIVAANEFIYVK
ncbi:MAG: PSD1 and planctomycete cytochrome C domain-containing protein [Deltaproteobacteria bacterium]